MLKKKKGSFLLLFIKLKADQHILMYRSSSISKGGKNSFDYPHFKEAKQQIYT